MHKKQQDNKNTKGTIIAGIAGAVVAGVAVAATMVMKDEKTKKKVEKILTNIKDQAMDYVDQLKEEPTTKEAVKEIKKIMPENKKADKENK